MSKKEERAVEIAYSVGLLRAHDALLEAHPNAAQRIAELYADVCRIYGLHNHIAGEENDNGTPQSLGSH